MPITKVPVQHKFGIISHSQRLQLEDRLARKALDKQLRPEIKKSPYDVDEQFIDQFNVSKGGERKKLEEKAYQMIERLKRRAGLKVGGQGDHVDSARAWGELVLLAQCEHEKLQEECLETLITSLDQATLSANNIPCLFYMAKSCLHWLKRDAMSQPFLRTGELKLLEMARLIFTRLFYHQVADNLRSYSIERTSLLQFLMGFSEQQDSYDMFPGALLAVKYIADMGMRVCTAVYPPVEEDVGGEEAEGASGENEAEKTNSKDSEDPVEEDSPRPGVRAMHDVSAMFWHALDVWRSTSQANIGLQAALHGLTTCTTSLSSEPWLDVSCAFNILAEASKLDLYVLKTFQALASGVPQKVVGVAPTSLHTKPYSTFAHHTSHRQTQPIAYSPEYNYRDIESQKRKIITEMDADLLNEMTKTPTFIHSLKEFANLDVVEDQNAQRSESRTESEMSDSTVVKAETLSTASQADESSVENFRVGSSHKKDSAKIKQERDSRAKSRASEIQPVAESDDESDEESHVEAVRHENATEENETTLKEGVSFNVDKDDKKQYDWKNPKFTRHDTEVTMKSLQTQGSSVSIHLPADQTEEDTQHENNSVHFNLPGIKGWHWELAYTYAECLTDICLSGKTSEIQKQALLGNRTSPHIKEKTELIPALGLLDLLSFQFNKSDQVPVNQDWSWHARCGALQGLVKICHCLPEDGKDGLRNIAWSALVHRQSAEKDSRVLESVKVGQVQSKLLERRKKAANTPSSLAARMATNLSVILLPPLPPPVAFTPSPRTPASRMRKSPAKKTDAPSTKRKAVTPSKPLIKDEILLATATHEAPMSYNTRASLELREVIEDQWRKQLHEEMEKEEQERKKAEAEQSKTVQEDKKSLDKRKEQCSSTDKTS